MFGSRGNFNMKDVDAEEKRKRTSIFALFEATSLFYWSDWRQTFLFAFTFFKLNVFMNISCVLGYFEAVRFNMHAHDYTLFFWKRIRVFTTQVWVWRVFFPSPSNKKNKMQVWVAQLASRKNAYGELYFAFYWKTNFLVAAVESDCLSFTSLTRSKQF